MAEKYIKIHGKLVAVTEEVYYAYYHMGRQCKTQFEKDARRRVTSYDALDTDEQLGVDLIVDENAPSIEDTAITNVLTEKLRCCLAQLPKADQELILSLFFEGLSEHQLARDTGIPRMTIHNRKVRVLNRLRKMMDN